jgi:uncharacterized protein YbbC (DUF1343 family)
MMGLATALLAGCGSPTRTTPSRPVAGSPAPVATFAAPEVQSAGRVFPVMPGIDVLEERRFAPLQGKRIGLLTHRAGVNRAGMRTVDVLHRAPNVRLTVLYAAEHGLDNTHSAEKQVGHSIDRATGLPVISLYAGRILKPTPAQLGNIDTLVIDLQDIGTRSYTFISMMKTAMEACFENGKEVIVLDRPNPLGGLKADGPMLDADLMSDVGRFRVPYVYGLTIGELALLVRNSPAPGGLAISAAARANGRLTVIPMRGWTRSMRWPETGLRWVPTSTWITHWDQVQGYPMVGLGCIVGGFKHGIGTPHPFRLLRHDRINDAVLERELRALNIPGLQFRRVGATGTGGNPVTGVRVEITNYNVWEPTRLNFELMRLACRIDTRNPFASITEAQRRTFLIHVGSTEFLDDLARNGARTNMDGWNQRWREQARAFHAQSQRFWLYR